mgnify:CR=1 FL=1
MLQGIENIVFDLGGVMIDLDRARCVEEFHKIGFTEIDDLIDSYHPKGFLGRLERGDVMLGTDKVYSSPYIPDMQMGVDTIFGNVE